MRKLESIRLKMGGGGLDKNKNLSREMRGLIEFERKEKKRKGDF